MSIGTNADYQTVAALRAGSQSRAAGGVKSQDEAAMAAFEMQMRMTRSLFGEGGGAYDDKQSLGGLDMSMVNDSMMLEALATINRLMRDEAGLPERSGGRNALRDDEGGQRQAEAVLASGPQSSRVGTLSAQFESGSDGIGAIGYDRVGGTSYGKYQIASKPGTMDDFISYLDEHAPDLAGRLKASGGADTGSTEGAMPEEWRAIAAENPDRFERLQHDFIESRTYSPARDMILKQTGLDFDNAPPALREVLWSTAVQHGPTGAARIFGKTIDRFMEGAAQGEFNAELIEGVYDVRKGQFGSSTKRVQQSVISRLNEEKQLALNMLERTPIHRVV
jgi:hypothetical protein